MPLLHVENKSSIWHLLGPNPNRWPFVFRTLPFCFRFLNLLVTLLPQSFSFFLVQWFLPCLSPVRFWPGETCSMLLSGLPVQDIWTLMTGKPMLLVLRVRTSFIFCHRQNIFLFPPILKGEQEIAPLKRNFQLCADTWRAWSFDKSKADSFLKKLNNTYKADVLGFPHHMLIS